MLCDDCKKRPATIYFKEVLPGTVKELHLCEACAQKRGLLMAQKMSPVEILQKLLKQKSEKDEKVICPVCYLSLAEFKRVGRFGCNECVKTFEFYLKKLVKEVQQGEKHVGKKPGKGEKKGYLVFQLRERLKKALDEEAYEEAAKIRDELKNFGVEDVE